MIQPPQREDWRGLMRTALAVVDSLAENGYGALDFRFGGGTVLMLRFDHRVSKDIDLFIDDAQALGFLTPRLNDVAGHLAQTYTEQANALKLVLNAGDIDFIVAGTVIRPPGAYERVDFAGRPLTLDSTDEILAKKMLYRADTFKARDVFDMSAALDLDAPAALRAVRATPRIHDVLLRRLSRLAAMDADDLTRDLMMTERGRTHAIGMVDKVVSAIERSRGPALE